MVFTLYLYVDNVLYALVFAVFLTVVCCYMFCNWNL